MSDKPTPDGLGAGTDEQTFQMYNVCIAFADRWEDFSAIGRPGHTPGTKKSDGA